jgi:hypothetical protein
LLTARGSRQVEHFSARISDTSLSTQGWTQLEQRAMTASRWWSVDELERGDIRYFPSDLTDLVLLAAPLV